MVDTENISRKSPSQRFIEQLEERNAQIEALIPSLMTTQWDKIWQEIQSAIPFVEGRYGTLPTLDHLQEPCGHIIHHSHVYDNETTYTVLRFHYWRKWPPEVLQLAFLKRMGDWEMIEGISYEEIPAALEKLGLPRDGWSNIYGRLQSKKETNQNQSGETRERDWNTYLQRFLAGSSYSLATPTIVSVTFPDDLELKKIWQLEEILRKVYDAYATGPIVMNVPDKLNILSFGFRRQEDLDLARRDLGLPEELQAGPPIYI